MNKDQRALVRKALAEGWEVKRAKRHLILISPCGQHRVTTSQTNAKGRATQNLRADLKRGGMEI